MHFNHTKGKVMRKYIYISLLSLVIILISTITSRASSAFMAAKEDKILTGRNGDWNNLNASMLVLPASEGKYGRIFLGAEGSGGFINTTGMNDQGLWYGATSLYDGGALPERNDIKNYYNKPTWPYELIEKIMEECTTIDEAIEIFETYFEPYWTGHYLIVDKNGNSVIVEFGENDVVFIRKKNNYQVMTNFPNADTLNARWYNCYRYKTAESMLASGGEISTDLFRTICDAVHQEGPSPTSLSTVYDLINGNLCVYYFYNYEEVLVLNLNEELAKGENYYRIPEYFNQIKLRYPIKGEHVNFSSVTFSWNGNADNYNLYYSTDPDFRDTKPILSTDSGSSMEETYSFAALWGGLLALGTIWIGKKKIIVLIIGFTVIAGFCLSCEIDTISSPFAPSNIEHRQVVDNLQPNTFYYWKVVAIGSNGINSESISHTFKTEY